MNKHDIKVQEQIKANLEFLKLIADKIGKQEELKHDFKQTVQNNLKNLYETD